MNEETKEADVNCDLKKINIEVLSTSIRNFCITSLSSFLPILIKALTVTLMKNNTDIEKIQENSLWDNFVSYCTNETIALAILIVVGLRSFVLFFFNFVDFQNEKAQNYYSKTQISRRILVGFLGFTIIFCIGYYFYLEIIKSLNNSLTIKIPFALLSGLYCLELVVISLIESSNRVLVSLNNQSLEEEQ